MIGLNSEEVHRFFKSVERVKEYTIQTDSQLDFVKSLIYQIQYLNKKKGIVKKLRDAIIKYENPGAPIKLYNAKEEIINNPIVIENKQAVIEPPMLLCYKTAWDTKDAARRALNKIKNNDAEWRRKKTPIRTYECNLCGKFHLTSKPDNKYYPK